MSGSGAPIRPFAVTNHGVLAIAIPMTFAYLSTPLVGVVDITVIGQIGDAALIGGIAIGAIIFDILFTGFNFLRSGTTGLAAQSLGARDDIEMGAIFWRSLGLGVLIGLLVIGLRDIILEPILLFMNAGSEVEAATRTYYEIRVLASPFTLANFAIFGWLLGLGYAKISVILQFLLNGVNIGCSAYFVLELGWGIEGVAFGSVIAEALTTVAGLVVVLRFLGANPWPRLNLIIDRDKLARMFSLNRDIMIRSVVLLFAFAFFTSQGAKSGDIVLAANAILMNFFLVGSYFLDGFAAAAEQLSGKSVGANYRPAFERTVKLTMLWGFALSTIAALILWLFGPMFIDLMTTNPDVRETARVYLFWAAISPLAGVMAFQMDGVFLGATWSQDIRNMMLASLIIYLIAWWLLVPLLGNHGLWIALNIFLGVRGLTLYLRYPKRAGATFS